MHKMKTPTCSILNIRNSSFVTKSESLCEMQCHSEPSQRLLQLRPKSLMDCNRVEHREKTVILQICNHAGYSRGWNKNPGSNEKAEEHGFSKIGGHKLEQPVEQQQRQV